MKLPVGDLNLTRTCPYWVTIKAKVRGDLLRTSMMGKKDLYKDYIYIYIYTIKVSKSYFPGGLLIYIYILLKAEA